jgi:hypothetical protein
MYLGGAMSKDAIAVDNRWTLAPSAEVGESIRLVRNIKVWQYLKGDVSWNVFKPLRTGYRTVPAGSVGKVLDKGSFAGIVVYTVQFSDIVVDTLKEYLFDVVD